jgi:hypothetical protein
MIDPERKLNFFYVEKLYNNAGNEDFVAGRAVEKWVDPDCIRPKNYFFVKTNKHAGWLYDIPVAVAHETAHCLALNYVDELYPKEGDPAAKDKNEKYHMRLMFNTGQSAHVLTLEEAYHCHMGPYGYVPQ